MIVASFEIFEKFKLMPSVDEYKLKGTSWVLDPPEPTVLGAGNYHFYIQTHTKTHLHHIKEGEYSHCKLQLRPNEVEVLVEEGVVKWIRPFSKRNQKKLKENGLW